MSYASLAVSAIKSVSNLDMHFHIYSKNQIAYAITSKVHN